jgi:SRSO17 transposase
MDRFRGMGIADRFAAYVGELTKVVGHADRAGPLRDYCSGLLATEGRRSVEPMAAVTAPARVSAQHQKLLHFVANAEWSDEQMLAKVRDLVTPSMTRQGPIEAWIIDDTSFPKKGRHSVGVHHQYCGQLGKQANCQVAVTLSIANGHGSLPIAYPAVFAAGVDGRQSAARRGACAALGQVQDQAAACAGADPHGCEGRRWLAVLC